MNASFYSPFCPHRVPFSSCQCLRVTMFHLDFCVHSLVRHAMPIRGWWFYSHLTGLGSWCVYKLFPMLCEDIGTARQDLANEMRVEVR